MRICIDTSALIYLVEKRPSKNNEDIKSHKLTHAWYNWIKSDKNVDFFVPSIVVAEMFSIDEELRKVREENFEQFAFEDIPFDLIAANIARKIWQDMSNKQKMPKNSNRQVLKMDIAIAASAIAINADKLITFDKDLLCPSSQNAHQGIYMAIKRLEQREGWKEIEIERPQAPPQGFIFDDW